MSAHFWPHTSSSNTASYRLRCLRIIELLRAAGMVVAEYKHGDVPERLILSKRYDAESVEHALYLKQRFGTKIYLDICDNHFYYSKPADFAIKRAALLMAAVKAVDCVICSSQYLAEVIKNEVIGYAPIKVVGDLVEFPVEPTSSDIIRHPISWTLLKNLKYSLNFEGVPVGSRLIWFGNHGSGFADGGMNDINSVKLYLEEAHKNFPLSLTIVSNSYKKYKSLTKRWIIPTFYLPWSRIFFSEVLKLHSISIIPILSNPFTMAKTSNRVDTSLAHGLSVIADPIPSYLEYKDIISLGSWGESLANLLCDNVNRHSKSNIEQLKNKNISVVNAWMDLLS